MGESGGRGRRSLLFLDDELEMASNFHSGGLTGAKFNDRNSFVCGKLILFPVLDAAAAAAAATNGEEGRERSADGL